MKDGKRRRMKRAVAICTDWLLASKGEAVRIRVEHEADEKLRPLGLTAYEHTKAMMRAMANLMEQGYVIQAAGDGWIQAITLDDLPPVHREEIIRRRANATSSGIACYVPEDSNG